MALLYQPSYFEQLRPALDYTYQGNSSIPVEEYALAING